MKAKRGIKRHRGRDRLFCVGERERGYKFWKTELEADILLVPCADGGASDAGRTLCAPSRLPLSRFSKLFCPELGLPDSSVGKESAYNTGDPSSIPGSGRSLWRMDRLPTPLFLGFPCGSAGKESACSVGDLGSIPRLGRSPGEGKGCPLQYSGPENSMDYIVHGVTKSQTWLSDFHFHFYLNKNRKKKNTTKTKKTHWKDWLHCWFLWPS